MSSKKLELLKSLKGHSGAIYDVISDDNFIYTTSADKFVVRWNVETGEQDQFAVKLEHTAFNIAFSAEYNQLIIGNSKGGLHVINTESKKEERYITQHKHPIFSVYYDPNKKVFYTADGDGYFCAWEAGTMKLLITLPLDCGKIRQISVDQNGEHIAICGQDGRLRILETSFFNEIKNIKINKDGVNTALFIDDFLLTGGKDAKISVWNWREEQLIQEIPAHNYAVYDLSYFEKSRSVVSVSFDKTIKLWSFPDLEIQQRIEFKDKGHRHTVNRLAQIDEDRFVTVSDDALIKVWQIKVDD